MSDLIAIAYPDQATAERVRGRLTEAIKAKVIEVDDAVVVTRSEDGKVKLHQSTSTAGVGAAGGALWGGLIGLLFLAPLLGMAVGAAAGAAGGALADYGVDDSFMKELGEKLTPGSAALIVLVRKMTPDKILPNIQEKGHVIQSSLSNDAEAELEAALEAAGNR
ncbi:MAG TPA: DUF1269 domain-containing protein [Thermoleophilaceae bacterium]|jgi:uncharacterized membrane protein|nr:DUF1269 domain-containing protein [Thermoleophilaceae bacterium]